jgi:hypothetical protein
MRVLMRHLMRRPGTLWSVASLAAALSLFAACSYSPQLKSGELKCSAQRECPRGYACSATNVCCANGDPSCGAGTGTGGVSGSGGSTGGRVAADYIGTWTFGATANVLTECDNGKSGNSSLASTTLAITAGATGGTALTANWSVWQAEQCPTTIALSYDATGAHLVDTNWFCEDDTMDPANYWLVNSFDVTLVGAMSGTHNGLYYREDTYADGSTVKCQQTVTATLTKTKN